MVTLKQATEFAQCSGGKIFAVEFVKRSDSSLREMVCRLGVKAHLAGGEPAYDFNAKGLLPVYDMQNGYRCIPLENITRIKIDGEWKEVKG